MPHYYAYCERHGKCGPNHDTRDPEAREKAWKDVKTHRRNVPGPHNRAGVKLSSRLTSSKGNVYYKYNSFFSEEN